VFFRFLKFGPIQTENLGLELYAFELRVRFLQPNVVSILLDGLILIVSSDNPLPDLDQILPLYFPIERNDI